MGFIPKWTKGHRENRCGTAVRQLKTIDYQNDGMTLVELMAGLIIALIISSIVIYTIAFEVRSWNSIVPNSNARSSTTFVLGKFQSLFQNISNPSEDMNYPSGTAITGTDPTGAKVEIRLQQSGIDHVLMSNGSPIEGLQVTVTPAVDNNNNPITPDVSNCILTFNDTSFNGTTFSVNGPMVDIHFQATYYGSSPPSLYQVAQQFATGGGD